MEQPLKYSDLLQPDNSIQQAIDQLEQLNKTYAQTLKTVKDEAIRLQSSIEGVSGATEEHRTRIRHTASETDKLEVAQRKLEEALSDNAVRLAELREQQRDAQNIARLQAKLNQSEEGSYNALAAQYALNKIQLNKLSKEYKTNTSEGQKLVRQTEELYSMMKEVQSVISQQAAEQQKAEIAEREHAKEIEQLAKAQRELDYATSDTAKRIAELNLQKREQQAINKLTAQLNSAEAGSYNALSAQYALNKIQLNKLSQEYRENTKEGRQLVKETEEIYARMKQLQEATGKYQLNVGNYASAWNGMGMAAQQLVRELPSLAVSANTFFLAISNNIPILIDEINRAREANAAAAAAAKAAGEAQAKTVPVWKQVTSAFLSWNTAISLGVTLLTLYGGEIVKWVQKLVTGRKELNVAAEAQKNFNSAMLQGRQDAQQELVRLDLLYNATQDFTKSMDDRRRAVQELKKEFPTYFSDLSEEEILIGNAEDAYNRLRTAIIETSMARAAEEKLIENSKQILALEEQRAKAMEKQKKAQADLNKEQALFVEMSGTEAGISTAATMQRAQSEVNKYKEEVTSATEKIDALREANKRLADSINVSDLVATPGKETNTGTQTGSGRTPRDRTQTITNKNINITETLYESNTDLIADDLQKQRQMLLDAYATETADLRNKQQNDKDLTDESREAINQIILNKEKKLQTDLEALYAQQQQRELQTQQAALQLRLDAAEQGSEEENNVRIQLIENARKQELLANSRLIESQKQDEAAINAKYDRQILQQDQAYQTERAMLLFDHQQALNQSEFDLLQTTEEEKTRFKLKAEKARLQKILQIAKTGGKQLSDIEIKTIQNTIKKIDKEIEQVSRGGNKDIYDLVGLKLDDDQKQAITDSVSFSIEQLQSILAAQVELKEQALQNAQEEVEAAQNRLNQEIEARNNGYANDVITAQKELQLSKQKEQQALKQKQKAQRQEQALDTLTQTSSLITATANIWKSLSGIPIVGYALAIAAIATMWSSFAAAKIKARQLTQTQDVEYGQGGLEILQGGSHQSGNDVDLGTMPDGRRRRAEGGEAVAIINKNATRKYRKELPSIIKSINQGTYSNDTYNYDNRNDIIKYIDKRIVEQLYTNAYTIDGITLSQNQPINNIDDLKKNVKKIADNSETRYYTDGRDLVIRYKNLTKRIIKR